MGVGRKGRGRVSVEGTQQMVRRLGEDEDCQSSFPLSTA